MGFAGGANWGLNGDPQVGNFGGGLSVTATGFGGGGAGIGNGGQAAASPGTGGIRMTTRFIGSTPTGGDLDMGGGGGGSTSNQGGSGGGFVSITAGTSIMISGSGVISANGSNGNSFASGGGGGGTIAVQERLGRQRVAPAGRKTLPAAENEGRTTA